MLALDSHCESDSHSPRQYMSVWAILQTLFHHTSAFFMSYIASTKAHPSRMFSYIPFLIIIPTLTPTLSILSPIQTSSPGPVTMTVCHDIAIQFKIMEQNLCSSFHCPYNVWTSVLAHISAQKYILSDY